MPLRAHYKQKTANIESRMTNDEVRRQSFAQRSPSCFSSSLRYSSFVILHSRFAVLFHLSIFFGPTRKLSSGEKWSVSLSVPAPG